MIPIDQNIICIFPAALQPEVNKSLNCLLRHMTLQQIDTVDSRGMTALHISVSANLLAGGDGSCEVEATLIDAGASLFVVDNDERLPLHHAFCSKYK